ncbi:hypothetical protein OYT88_11905 [Sporolactobacillus sp. CQH2019]|uniref:hypothetical protein n=1 Tax=Sporolactobacillus sp. CQH2019 TaxID=3023512 RepID=UPI002368B58A|nr:hypothetical protein [Sporolactobacillus sp. CQH2019]MDD9149258.1 hypothetical protein [Sporolactobacillus sp. CQH2019]
MTLAELYQILIQTGKPVFYSHWRASQQYPECPPPPFICYWVPESPNMIADDKVYQKIDYVEIELYTDKKDLTIEAVLEQLLDDNDIAYTSSEVWIDTEKLFEKIYEMELIRNG